MRYWKAGAIEGLDLTAVSLVKREIGFVLVMAGPVAVQLHGADGESFLGAWRAHVAEMDGPVIEAAVPGESRDGAGSESCW